MHAFDGQTDRRTDGRTDGILIARPRLHSMQRGKNCVLNLPQSDILCTSAAERYIDAKYDNYPFIV